MLPPVNNGSAVVYGAVTLNRLAQRQIGSTSNCSDPDFEWRMYRHYVVVDVVVVEYRERRG